MMEITIRDEFIKLGQALKAAGCVDSGVEAKLVIQNELVLVNDYPEDESKINEIFKRRKGFV